MQILFTSLPCLFKRKAVFSVTYRHLRSTTRLKKAVKIASARRIKPVLTMLTDTLDCDPTGITRLLFYSKRFPTRSQLCIRCFRNCTYHRVIVQRISINNMNPTDTLLKTYLITCKFKRNNSSRFLRVHVETNVCICQRGKGSESAIAVNGVSRSMTNTLLHRLDFLHVALTFRLPHSYWCSDSAARKTPETERSR